MPSDIRCEAESMVTKRLELLDYIFAPLKNQDEILMVYREELSRFNTAKLIEAKRGFFFGCEVQAEADSFGDHIMRALESMKQNTVNTRETTL